uniref:Sushi, von Willebrand factor type A, EGF and pentraxin domain-containing protein 1 n=1 Tax=Saccoglossus kowalevskii TaxID=10224 RepID=A0ABM0M9B5_SACKO|nr:PREDICTED: sushi, von Willebrand factor type A, EGF and pentraxin domain-containing protein 1 [Saccoglossus kowalevskii]
MKITQSHVSGAVFVWGQHTVRYSAEDMTGNVAVCEFQVHLSPSSCPSYPAPINGATACDDWLFGQFCSVSCNIEYEFASKPAEWYICDATGNWRTSPPALTLPWPDCSKRYVAKAAHKGMKHQYYTGNCNNPKTQQMIKEQFVNAFKLSVFGKSGGCKTVENACEISAVIVYCGAIDNTLRRRRRRDVSDLDNVVTIEFSVLVKILEPTDDEEVAEEKLNIVFDTIQDITVEFRNQTLQGQLSLDVENETLVANDDYFETEPTVPMCEDGTILSGKRCVNCPVGTYYDVISGMCSLCFPGYYQDEEAQLECKACDNGTWTDGAHAKNYTSCIDVCNPGTYSVNGLMTCKSCPIGTYQPISRQTECMPCPEGTTTWVEGANALEDCQATCSPGTYSVKGLEPCAPCPIGFYQTFRGQKYCLPCDDHLTTYGMGTVSAEYCQVVDSCSSSPCHNNGVCENHDVSYTCDCAVGYTGSNCEIDVDECQSSPCAFNSTCLDRVNGFQCVCTPGYKGQHCEVEINECLMASCLNNGQCQDEIDGYHCICVEGFTGEFCEIQPDNCASDPCQNQGLCIDHADGFVCVCRDGFDGLHCGLNVDECQSMPCLNGARCIDLEFDYECECTLGYTGQNCEVNIDDCIQHQCENGATCQDGVNTYTCRCSPTFSGRYCENKMSDDFDLLFTRPVTADVAILRDRVPLLEAFTVMFWMKTNDTSNSGTPMSYATMDGNDTESDAIVLTNYAGFNLMVNGETAYTDVALNDGTWHHVVVTWTNRGGAWRFYVDGVLASTGEHLRDSDVIFGGGVLVVGQEQDEPSGGFSPVEAYIGHISKLNIWDYVMSAESIVIISGCCYGTPGNVVAWSDFKNNIYGNVEITSPSKVCTGDSCGFENDKCHSQLCHHGGTCLDEAGYIVCVCPTGYSGLLCELETRCGSPPEIEHGNVITDNEDLLVGTIADYTCDNGYDHSGVSSLSCMNDGHWENNKVGCSDYNECLSDDSMCQHLCINSNGTYVCDCNQGYQLHSDGHTCIDINECLTDMYGLQNGGCEDTCTNTRGSYFCTCPIGYELTPNGIHCRDIDECSTGMNDCQQKCRNTLGSYTCECHPGYYLHSNGRHCQAMSCPQPLKPNHGTLVYPEFDEIQYGTIMTVNCFPGYHLIGERFRTCDMTGKWTGSDSQCIEVNCGTIGSMMENGNVVISGTGLHDTASFTCNDGFYLIGSQAMQCQEDGIWSGSRPYCGLKLT